MNIDTNGYLYRYNPNSPYANKAGKVYEHIRVMCVHLGRRLNLDECVHHIDRNKLNNDLSNLLLLSLSEHAKLHMKEDRGGRSETRECPVCHKEFTCYSSSDQVYCSSSCSKKANRKFDITEEELEKLVWSMPTTKVAKLYGVSDKAIEKRCKLYNISKPPRGYWRRIKSKQVSS